MAIQGGRQEGPGASLVCPPEPPRSVAGLDPAGCRSAAKFADVVWSDGALVYQLFEQSQWDIPLHDDMLHLQLLSYK